MNFYFSSRRRLRLELLKDLKRDIYFWENYLVLESNADNEDAMEKSLDEIVLKGSTTVVFNKKEFINAYRAILVKSIPEPRPEINRAEQMHVEKQGVTVQVKEVYQYLVDELRIAHECLLGLGRPQEVARAIKIYQTEDEKDNINVLNVLGQLHLEGVYLPKDLSRVMSFFQQVKRISINTVFKGPGILQTVLR